MNVDDLADDATQVVPAKNTGRPVDKVDKLIQPLEQDNDVTVLAQPTRKPVMPDHEVTVLATETFRESHKDKQSETLKVGAILNKRFVLKQVLGSGGMGTVFRATDLRRQEARDRQTDVALKVLNEEFRDNPELFIALQRETKKSQMLAHPNIVHVFDFDRDGRNIFMVMEMLEGKPLSQFMREMMPQGGMSFEKAWPIIKGMASALDYAHKKNIIHSDIKPGNIFITNGGEVKVLDFGIARATVRSDYQDHDDVLFNARDLSALTPAYASLEMFENRDPDPRDDIYALACVSYELLAGKHPFGKLSAQKVLEVNLKPPAIPGLKRQQWKALKHALELKREQRTVSISQFFDEIASKSPWPPIIGSAAAVALIAAAGGYAYMHQNTQPEVVGQPPEQQIQVEELPEQSPEQQIQVEELPEQSPERQIQVEELPEQPPERQIQIKDLLVHPQEQQFQIKDLLVHPQEREFQIMNLLIHPQEQAFLTTDLFELTPEQKIQVKSLLELAQIHFEVGYITAPSKSNALWTYRQALSIDPYNKEAQQGLERIASLLEKQAIELFDQNKFDQSLVKIEKALEVLPKKERLQALKKQILRTRQ